MQGAATCSSSGSRSRARPIGSTCARCIAEHAERTGSPVAARVLALGDDAPFVKVMPHDFKRVLEQPLSVGGAGFVTRETEAA